ncbi:NACHT domain-containing protein [Roseateles amylovorans]|uniref:NACHT C-terminal Alpha/Beta 2 domain-containing protein n=1 Tax=Roseateles amylovorans TaxID=2978473 RepID=A0ABY6B0E5_9BURK|nr:hypothetical protein [Roseateles amylovorans]UXH78871.1 hypothetical protein N4261_02710 [Roseateles amylovorans]
MLAGRAGYACSNPDCRRPTAGAALGDDAKFVSVGVAAHIKGAAPGGPRYDPLQTAEERRDASNGIWLCSAHAKQIDDDHAHFTVDQLKSWKQQAEASSAFAILTLQAPDANALQPEAGSSTVGLAQRLGLLPRDNVEAVTARLRAAAARDLDAFLAALKSPADVIALGLRLIESERVTPFGVAGLAAAIGTFNEIVVVAPPGTGKTTTLLQVVRSIAANENLVAAFVPLSEWSAQGQTLLQSIVRRAAFAGEREEHLKLLADGGRLVLCMDGWNELDRPSRKRLRSEVQGMQRDFPGLGIVMSTRVQALDVPISGPVVEIEPLSEAQQLAIARAYRGEAGEGLLDQAWRTSGLRDLVAIPLYLTKLLSDTPGGNLPTTKEEVLRLFVAEIDRNAAAHEVLQSATAGFHGEMLSAIAIDATVADSVTVSDHRARRLISDVAGRLVREGQMTAPQPDVVLAALVSHHLLVRTASGVEFQHQQFQEWFASHEVEALARAAAAGDVEARKRMRTEVLNTDAWEEAVLFACERASRGDADGVAGAVTLILEALTIDPMLAAEAIYRSSDTLWSAVKDRVVEFADRWHTPKEIDRAVRFMIKTGRAEFAETLWAFLADPNDQVYLKATRVGGRFRPSVLGSDIASRISKLPPTHRSHLLSELVMYGGVQGIETATSIALSDGDAVVMNSVAESLHFRRANRQLQRLLTAAPREVWQALARKGYAEESMPPGLLERMRQESQQLIQDEQSAAQKLRALLHKNDDRQAVAAAIKPLIEAGDFSDEEERAWSAIDEAGRLYPEEVRDALRGRLERRLPFPFRAEELLRGSTVIVDDGPIAELALEADVDRQLANAAAGLLGSNTTGRLIDALPGMREQLKQSPPAISHDEYHRVRGLVALTPLESFIAAVLPRACTSDPTAIGDLADLIARHGESGDRGRLGLGDASRDALIATVRRWVDVLLADETSPRRILGEVARVIERLAALELTEPLARMLARDLKQWRQQREESIAARARGKHDGASEAFHSWNLQYARAFVAIGDDQAIATLQSYLMDTGLGGFGIDAAGALSAIGQRQLGMTNDTPFRGLPEFSNVRMRRAERQGSLAPETCSIAEAIFAAVDKLLQDGAGDEALAHALQLAATALALPYGDKRAIIDRLQRLPQPYGKKLRFFTALVNAGELIDAQLIVESIDALLEDAKTKPWLLQENQGEIDRWLLLLPFTSRPEVTLDVLARLHPHIRLPWRLRPLLSALGFAPSDAAEQVLMCLAKEDARFLSDYYWFAALENRDTLSSLRALLDLICDGEAKGEGGQPDTWTFGRRLAAGMRSHPEFRADVYARVASGVPPPAMAILEYAVAETPDEAGVMLLVGSHSATGRAFSGTLDSAIENLAVERRPLSDWAGAYEQISAPVPSLRRRLFELSRTATSEEASLALACLVHIDELRDMHGVASGEPRHPDIATGAPWPTLLTRSVASEARL